MSPEKALQVLENIKRLTIQTEQGITSNVEVQKSHPERLERIETWAKLMANEARLLKEEDEVGVAYWDEISDAFPIIISRLNDHMTIQKNFNFIAATDKGHLDRFLSHILMYGLEIFSEVIGELPDSDFAKIEDVVDIARRQRT